MIKNIVFDIGNVLMKFDYMPYIRKLLKDEDVIAKVNNAIWTSNYWNDLDRGGNTAEILEKMLAAEPEYRDEIKLTFDNVGQCMFRTDYAIPWIKELKSRGYMAYYLSNYAPHTMEANPDVLDFLPYMDGGVFSCDVHVIKPEPEIFSIFCEKYDLMPSECIFLDDNERNVLAAKDFGMNAIHFTEYEQAKKELEKALQKSARDNG